MKLAFDLIFRARFHLFSPVFLCKRHFPNRLLQAKVRQSGALSKTAFRLGPKTCRAPAETPFGRLTLEGQGDSHDLTSLHSDFCSSWHRLVGHQEVGMSFARRRDVFRAGPFHQLLGTSYPFRTIAMDREKNAAGSDPALISLGFVFRHAHPD